MPDAKKQKKYEDFQKKRATKQAQKDGALQFGKNDRFQFPLRENTMPEWKKNWIDKKRMEEKGKRKEKDGYDYDNFNKAPDYKKQKNDKN